MSASPRDQEALDVAAARSFADTYLASFALDMQTRRLTLRLYGPLRGGEATYVATLTFFGASALRLENAEGAFPHSARVAAFRLFHKPGDDEGTAELRGRSQWSVAWSFDGFAYEEHAAILASLADDL